MQRLILLLVTVVFFGINFPLLAQKINSSYRLHIKKATSPVIIDGVLEEEAWMEADVAENFYMILPIDTSYAEVLTDVRMTFDDKNLYLFVTNYHGLPGPY